jgi:hypothetical protein
MSAPWLKKEVAIEPNFELTRHKVLCCVYTTSFLVYLTQPLSNPFNM